MKDNLRLGGDYRSISRDPIKEDKYLLATLYFLAASGAITWTVIIIWLASKAVNSLVELKILD